MIETAQLQAVALFRPLSAARRRRLLEAGRVQRYDKGTTLFRQGDPATVVWVILEGWVHLVRSATPEAERPVVIFTVTPDEALCGLSALEGGRYQVTATAGAEGCAVRIPAAALTATLRAEPAFAYAVLQLCIRRLQHVAQQYGAMTEPVSRRIIRAILRLRRQFGPTLPVTHRELAQMSWTTTESAIRIVRALKAQGHVSGARGQLTVAQPEVLERLLLAASNGHRSPVRSVLR